MEGINPAVARYFLQQQHGGALPVYMGVRHQRGHGLGNVLAGAMRYVTPIVKDVGRSALTQVPFVVKETLRGRPIKQTLANVALDEGKKFLGQTILKRMNPFRGATLKKRKTPSSSVTSARVGKRARRVVSHKGAASGKGKKRRVAQDIFN